MLTSARYISVNNCKINHQRLCNLLRNSPPDCFCQICKQIWSSLSLVRVNKIAKEKPIRISVSAFFGSPSWTRTNDPAVNSRMLYQLSY